MRKRHISFLTPESRASQFAESLSRQPHIASATAFLEAAMDALIRSDKRGQLITLPLQLVESGLDISEAQLEEQPPSGGGASKEPASVVSAPEPQPAAPSKLFAVEADPDDLVKGIWSKDGPMPTNREWKAFLEERYRIPEAPWDACRNYHAEFFAWRKERAEAAQKGLNEPTAPL